MKKLSLLLIALYLGSGCGLFSPDQYTLKTSIEPANGGLVMHDPSSGPYDEGISVKITATANSGYEFWEWTGDTASTTNPISIYMTKNKTITANFRLIDNSDGDNPGDDPSDDPGDDPIDPPVEPDAFCTYKINGTSYEATATSSACISPNITIIIETSNDDIHLSWSPLSTGTYNYSVAGIQVWYTPAGLQYTYQPDPAYVANGTAGLGAIQIIVTSFGIPGERIKGTFTATVNESTGAYGVLTSLVITEGEFNVIRTDY